MLQKFYLFGLWVTFFTLFGLTMKINKTAKFYAANYHKIGLSGRVRIIVLMVFAGLTYLVFIHPIDANVTSTAVLQPKNLTLLTAPRDATLAEVYVSEGDCVKKGDAVMRFKDDELDTQIEQSRLQVKIIESYLQQERAALDLLVNPDSIAKMSARVETSKDSIRKLTDNIKELEHKKSELTVVSPVDGCVISTGMKSFIGRGFQEGEGLIEIGDPSVMVAQIQIPHKDFGKVAVGQKATLKIKALKDDSLEGEIETRSARQLSAVSDEIAASSGGSIFTRRNPFTGAEVPLESVFQATMTVPNDDGVFRKGMTGKAYISYGKTTIAANIWEGLWSWVKNILRL
jgi:multidrug efflux pump subunit AcrA (membrane-fusion protein)